MCKIISLSPEKKTPTFTITENSLERFIATVSESVVFPGHKGTSIENIHNNPYLHRSIILIIIKQICKKLSWFIIY